MRLPFEDHPRRRRIALHVIQAVLLLAVVGFFSLEVVRSWGDIEPRLSEIRWSQVALATVVLAVYYLAFVPGWMLVLRSFGMRIGYGDALGAEMLSMLAKYVPGGVWTPAARIVATRRLGLPSGPVLASIGYEAGLSAISGIVIFAVALPFQSEVDLPVPLWLILGFAALLVVLLHPRIFGPVADRLLRPLDSTPVPRLPLPTALLVLLYYACTWLIGGLVLVFLVRSVGDAPISAAPYLGGVSAVGATIAVLVVFAPSGLGVREGAVFALLLPLVDRAGALVVVALNRLLITGVEVLLLGAVAALRPRRMRLRLDEDAPSVESPSGV